MIVGESTSEETAASGMGGSQDVITEKLVLLETNIDDMPGQAIGFVLERALDLGALDCWVTPVQMKKNRPGTLLSVLCSEGLRFSIENLLLRKQLR